MKEVKYSETSLRRTLADRQNLLALSGVRINQSDFVLTEYGRRLTIVTNIQNDPFHLEYSRISHKNCRISALFRAKNIIGSNRLKHDRRELMKCVYLLCMVR